MMSSAIARTYVRGVTGFAVAAVLALAACGGDDSPTSTTAAPTTTASHTDELAHFVLSMCLTDSTPAQARRSAEAKGWPADDVEFVVGQVEFCP